MPNKALDTELLDRAIKFAVDAHAGTERRGKGFPYIIHPLEAVEIVATMTNDQELLAAAALHDTVEDTAVTIEDIRENFGERVALLVKAESDDMPAGKSETDSWRARKQAAIDRIAASSRDAKMVALGDKLSNIRAIRRDYAVQGDRLWSLFHAPGGAADHEWHYRGLADSLSELEGTDAYAEFTAAVETVFGHPLPELVDMREWKQSGDGYTAVSYTSADGERMIKMYSEFVPSFVPEQELRKSRSVAGMGIRVPAALRLVTDGKRLGVEFECIRNKRSFARAISQEPDRLVEYMSRFARMCREIHSIPCDKTLFHPVQKRFLDAIAESDLFDDSQKARMAAFVNSVPEADTCIHGDMHIGNTLIADGLEYWIDISDFAYGNPLFDLGMFYFLAYGVEEQEICENLFHFSSETLKRCWEVFVKEYFGSERSLEDVNREIAPIAALYMLSFEHRSGLRPGMKEYIEKHLLSNE